MYIWTRSRSARECTGYLFVPSGSIIPAAISMPFLFDNSNNSISESFHKLCLTYSYYFIPIRYFLVNEEKHEVQYSSVPLGLLKSSKENVDHHRFFQDNLSSERYHYLTCSSPSSNREGLFIRFVVWSFLHYRSTAQFSLLSNPKQITSSSPTSSTANILFICLSLFIFCRWRHCLWCGVPRNERFWLFGSCSLTIVFM